MSVAPVSFQAAFKLRKYTGTVQALLNLLELDPSTTVRVQVSMSCNMLHLYKHLLMNSIAVE